MYCDKDQLTGVIGSSESFIMIFTMRSEHNGNKHQMDIGGSEREKKMEMKLSDLY